VSFDLLERLDGLPSNSLSNVSSGVNPFDVFLGTCPPEKFDEPKFEDRFLDLREDDEEDDDELPEGEADLALSPAVLSSLPSGACDGGCLRKFAGLMLTTSSAEN